MQNIPVIFLTALGDEASVVTGLNMGTDDYITKPFRPHELIARIGTAYAGKSTMCKLLADKYDLTHCEENYNGDKFNAIAQPEVEPNMCYFCTHNDWQKFLNRTPQEYEAWIYGNARDMAEFEIVELKYPPRYTRRDM